MLTSRVAVKCCLAHCDPHTKKMKYLSHTKKGRVCIRKSINSVCHKTLTIEINLDNIRDVKSLVENRVYGLRSASASSLIMTFLE